MADLLDQIVLQTRQRVEAQKNQIPLAQMKKRLKSMKSALPFARALRRPEGIAVIAELKQSSPSAGVIRQEADWTGRLEGYVRGGAVALSILTEESFFQGSPHHLELARRKVGVPLLRKDFIVDPYQIEESRVLGADAILLIAALLPGGLLEEFLDQAGDIGLEALVEVHDERDLESAVRAEAPLIGINNRNLRTLSVDLTTSKRLLPRLRYSGRTIVVESGIRAPEQLPAFYAMGAHAVLIGETLMRDPDPEKAVRSFVQAGRIAAKEDR
jgi:indole-3-glycerol phosphate synthase